MSSNSSYVPWSSKGSSYSRTGSSPYTSTNAEKPAPTYGRASTYGSLPRNYGGTYRSSVERAPEKTSNEPKPYSTRFSRGYSVEKSAETPKSPEGRKYNYETPSLRVGSSSRFGGQIARSPISEKIPNVFGISPVSDKSTNFVEREPEKIILVTRSTSPTTPCNSAFLRAKRAEMEICIKQEVIKPTFRPYVHGETQTEDPKAKVQVPKYRGYIKPEEHEEKKEPAPKIGGLSFSRPTDLLLPPRTRMMVTDPKSDLRLNKCTSVNALNKDFRKSVLNMGEPIKKNESSSESDSSSESSSEDSSEEESKSKSSKTSDSQIKPPKPPIRNDSKTVIVKTITTATPVKVKLKEEEEKPKFVLRKFDSGERAWWASNKDIPNLENDSKSDKSSSGSKSSLIKKSASRVSLENKSNSDKSKSFGTAKESVTNGLSKSETCSEVSKDSKILTASKTSSLQKTKSGVIKKSPSLITDSIKNSGKSAIPTINSSIDNKISLSRSGSGLQRTGSNLSDLTTDDEKKLSRSPSSRSLQKTTSSASISSKPPISRNENQEHTPGFNRIHKRLGSNNELYDGIWSPTGRRPLIRVESGERDWWLSDEEKAAKKAARSPSDGKIFVGFVSNIDDVLGCKAPPPAAFRTHNYSSDGKSYSEKFNYNTF